MTEQERQAREYCEKNIPSQKDMHLTVSTAFEAGWEAAIQHLGTMPFDKMLDCFSEYYKAKKDGRKQSERDS